MTSPRPSPRPSLRALFDEALPGAARPAIHFDEGPLTGVSADSRRVVPGSLFVVLRGTQEDGAAYAEDAVRRGAAAIVAPEDAALPSVRVPVIRTPDTRGALALLAAAFHGRPSEDLTVVGVTGTNGKTTTTHLLDGVLGAAGRGPCAVLGTIAYAWPGVTRPAPNTTPGADDLQALLAEARDAGCRAAALEVSSHALDQRRVEGVRFAGAVFTNLSGDHLDYHGSMDDYAEAKARLFRGLDAGAGRRQRPVRGRRGPVRAHDALRGCDARVLRYGLDAPSAPDVTARDLRLSADGVRVHPRHTRRATPR